MRQEIGVSRNVKERPNSLSWNKLEVPGHVSKVAAGATGRRV